MYLSNGDGIEWPDGKRVAVLLTFDFDAELLRYAVIGRGKTGFADISRGKYGPDEGLDRCLRVLNEEKVPATFFVPGKICEIYPECVKAIADGGYELAYHGYDEAHDVDAKREIEMAAIERSEELLKNFSGRRPVGARGVLDTLSNVALQLYAERGYLYDSTLMDCDWAYLHTAAENAEGLVELPTEPGLNDFSFFYFSYADVKTITCSYPAAYVREFWQDYFDELAREGDKVMVLRLHPQLIGRSGRVRMLGDLIHYMRAHGAWFADCETTARYVKKFYAARRRMAQ